MLTNAAAAAAELRTVVARLPASITSLEGGLRTARGATTDIQAELAPILRDLRAAVGNLRDTTEQLRRYPSQAILGAPPPPPERR
jgi:paraquat-inducible protein B